MSFAQGSSTQPLVLQGSNVFLYGSSTSGNAFTVQQLSSGNVASFQTLAGATSLIINPTGYVGIGTTNPGYVLDVNGSARIATNTLTLPTVLATTSVGIGTNATPPNKLSILSTTAQLASSAQISHPVGDWGLVIKRTANDVGTSNFAFLKSRGETSTIITQGDGIGRIAWHAVTNASGPVIQQLGEINVTNTTFSAGNADGDMIFLTKNTSDANPVERMRVTGDGLVGIGTNPSNTSYKLQIYNGDTSFALFGPNATWGSYLAVGAATSLIGGNLGTGQIISTNGNIHIDGGSDGTTKREIYLQYYQNTGGTATGGVRSYGYFNHTGDHYISGIPYSPGRPMSQIGKNNGDLTTGVMIFNAVAYNVGSMYSTSTGRWTAAIAGYYRFSFCGLSRYLTTTPNMRWYKNGADFGYGAGHFNQGTVSGVYHLQIACSVIIYLAVNDYVNFQIVGDGFYGSNAIHCSASCFFLG